MIRICENHPIINNNPIEAFNGQFKRLVQPKRGFKSFDSANLLISLLFSLYNFVRPHSSLNNLAPVKWLVLIQ